MKGYLNVLRGVLVVLGLVVLSTSNAKSPYRMKFNFAYVAHNATMPTDRIIDRLQAIYDAAVKNEDAAVFYLPNGTAPIVVRVNVGTDNRSDFENLKKELLSQRTHPIDVDTDLSTIMDLMAKNDIVNKYGQLMYNTTTLDFYVNKSFWLENYNNKVIGALYYACDWHRFVTLGNQGHVKFYLNIYRDKNEDLDYPKGKPFGDMNIESINELPITTY